MINILFLTGKLQHYRVPIFNIIGSYPNIRLTIAHSGKLLKKEGDTFEEVQLKEKKVLIFTIHEGDLYEYCSKFDVVVAMFYVQKLSFVKLAFKSNRSFKLIYWGIGVRASQTSQFDSAGISNLVRNVLVKKADALIFYTDYPIQKYVNQGNSRNKFFVMPNTVAISNEVKEEMERDSILFVGTLNKSKKIFELLENYLVAFKFNNQIPELKVIGEGVDFEEAVEWVKNNGLNERVKFLGPIYDENSLEAHFKKALVCISPGQAGLSVLKSMGYGVPFVTKNDAITGGERLNIKNDINGVLYYNHYELKDILLDITINKHKYLEMGQNAKEYYLQNRTPEKMANGFIEAVNFVINTNNIKNTR